MQGLDGHLTYTLDGFIKTALYSLQPGCSAVGSAPRLGRGGQRFESAHPDFGKQANQATVRPFPYFPRAEAMAKVKIDGVVQAVRYGPDGRVAWVRAFLRRGPTWSDTILLDRETLIKEITSGKQFYSGARVPLLGGTFETHAQLRLIEKDGQAILVTGDTQMANDRLEGVPLV